MDLVQQLRSALVAQSLPTPSSTFLTTLVTARSPPPPLPSLLATAKARLLSGDLATDSNIERSAVAAFPPTAGDVQKLEVKLTRHVHVQVLDVENLSLSRWEQVEQLEAIERGEHTRGREIIHVTADEDRNDEGTQSQQPNQRGVWAGPRTRTGAAASGNATHRLVLQDHEGTKLFALELQRNAKIGVGITMVGEKWLLKAGTTVARGTVLLTPANSVLLGGKVEAWHKTWTEGSMARLKAAIGTDRPATGQ